MTPNERAPLLATAALAVGRADPGVISTEDKAFLRGLLGDNADWPTVTEALMPLIRSVADTKV